VRFHAAIPPDAPLPTTITGYTLGERRSCMGELYRKWNKVEEVEEVEK
jgi:hypothetical protein